MHHIPKFPTHLKLRVAKASRENERSQTKNHVSLTYLSFLLAGVSVGLVNGRFSPTATGESRAAAVAPGTVPELLEPGIAGGVATFESIISSENRSQKQY